MNEQQFRDRASELGYGEPTEVSYAPQHDSELHTHEFSAFVLVTEGALTLGREDGETRFAVGEWCEVPSGTLHCERTGAEGARMLIARK